VREDGQWDAVSREDRRAFAAHLASAVSGLEQVRLVHGDLSPGNVMIGPGPNERHACCICDFDGFYHPYQPAAVPRVFERVPSRPLGNPEYRYPALAERIAKDKKGVDQSVFVETDRFALGVLICEMMVWNSTVAKRLGRGQLLDAAIIMSRKLEKHVPDDIINEFPKGFSLLDKALKAGSCGDMPEPVAWLSSLGIESSLPISFTGTPHILFYRASGATRKLQGEAFLKTKPGAGHFGAISPELAFVGFELDANNGVTLNVGLHVPTALRRNGRQETVRQESKSALSVLPGDVVRIGEWEITFEA
jgi:serine/threonine protein kinase